MGTIHRAAPPSASAASTRSGPEPSTFRAAKRSEGRGGGPARSAGEGDASSPSETKLRAPQFGGAARRPNGLHADVQPVREVPLELVLQHLLGRRLDVVLDSAE